MKNESDNWYINEIKKGNTKAENDLFIRFNRMLESHVKLNSGSRIESDELYIEVMITVYDHIKIGKLDDIRCALKTYVWAVGKLKWKEVLRKKDNNKMAISYDQIDFYNDTGIKHEEEAERNEIIEEWALKLGTVLSKLGERCRAILMDKYYNGLKPDELAVEYAITNGRQATKKASKCMTEAREIGRKLLLTMN